MLIFKTTLAYVGHIILSIKIDEIYINKILDYNSKYNCIIGTCYNHSKYLDTSFHQAKDADILV